MNEQPKKDIDLAKKGRQAKKAYDKILTDRAQEKRKVPEEIIPRAETREEEAAFGDQMSYHYRIMNFSKNQNEDNN